MFQMPSICAFLAVLFLLNQKILAWDPSTFSGYPSCAQNIWLTLAPETCDHGTSTTAEVDATNSCLCYDTAYLTAAAQAIWTECGCSILITCASLSEGGCNDTVGGTSVNANEFIAAGDGGQATCQDPGQVIMTSSSSLSTASSTSPSSPSPASSSSSSSPSNPSSRASSTTSPDSTNNNNKDNGSIGSLSAGTVAGITVATVVFTAIAAGVAVYECLRRRRRRHRLNG